MAKHTKQTTFNYLAIMCEHFDVSDCVGAAIASVVLKDFSMIDDKTLTKVTDKSKFRREDQTSRQKLGEDEERNHKMVNAIYVNGRKNATLTTVDYSQYKFYSKIEIEEHYIIVEEPVEMYLTHFSVEESKDVTIAKNTYKALGNTDLQNSLSIVGSDGTAIMTGKHHGSIATLQHCCKDLCNELFVS